MPNENREDGVSPGLRLVIGRHTASNRLELNNQQYSHTSFIKTLQPHLLIGHSRRKTDFIATSKVPTLSRRTAEERVTVTETAPRTDTHLYNVRMQVDTERKKGG